MTKKSMIGEANEIFKWDKIPCGETKAPYRISPTKLLVNIIGFLEDQTLKGEKRAMKSIKFSDWLNFNFDPSS